MKKLLNIKLKASRKFACLCHDVTEEEIFEAIEAGYDDLELLKRLTGVTTGPCQGKTCMMHVLELLRKKGKLREAKTTTIRPPVDPILIAALVRRKDGED